MNEIDEIKNFLEKHPLEKRDYQSWQKNLDANIRQNIISTVNNLTLLALCEKKLAEFPEDDIIKEALKIAEEDAKSG